MIKTVIIVNDSNYISGGEDKVAIFTANELLCQCPEIEVVFFSCNDGLRKELNDNIRQKCTNQGSALASKNKIKGAFNGIANFKAKKELKNLLLKYDKNSTIIHVHSWSKAITSEVFDLCFKLGYKCILTLHDYFIACPNGGFFNYQTNSICGYNPMSMKCMFCNCDSRNYFFKLYRLIRQIRINANLKKIKHVITISEFSEKILQKYLCDDCTIDRVYNPIDFEKKQEKVDPTKSNFYLYVGRISKEKGVEIFCECVSSENEKGIVVGDGDYRRELENKYQGIEFLGWKSSEEVKKIMKQARCLIIPSKWYECAPLTPLEAMQFGIPCISSANNATVDYLKNDVGLIYSSSEELKKIIRMCKSDDVIEKYSNNAFNYIKSEWAKKKYIDELILVYNNVLSD